MFCQGPIVLRLWLQARLNMLSLSLSQPLNYIGAHSQQWLGALVSNCARRRACTCGSVYRISKSVVIAWE